jgi:hypothetical protein
VLIDYEPTGYAANPPLIVGLQLNSALFFIGLAVTGIRSKLHATADSSC